MKLKQLMALAAIVTPSLSFAVTIDMGTSDYGYGGTIDYGVQLSHPSSDGSNTLGASEILNFSLIDTDPYEGTEFIPLNTPGSAVPEPSTCALFALGVTGVFVVAKRKRIDEANGH